MCKIYETASRTATVVKDVGANLLIPVTADYAHYYKKETDRPDATWVQLEAGGWIEVMDENQTRNLRPEPRPDFHLMKILGHLGEWPR